jgi:hypothetical protein
MKLLIPILVALLCNGCFVMDELDKGMAEIKAHDGKPDDAEASEKSDAKAPPKSPRERLADYYAEQRAKAAAPTQSVDPNDDVGRCRVGTSVQFMRRSDCRLRGGTFL